MDLLLLFLSLFVAGFSIHVMIDLSRSTHDTKKNIKYLEDL